jgi:flagellar hook-length control protein FliK
MTIELSPASTEAKPSAASEAKSSKTGAAGAEKSGAGGPGGFMAILASVDPDPVLAPAEAEQGSLASPTGLLPTLLADPIDLAGVNAKVDLAMDASVLMALSLQWKPAQPVGGDAAAGGRQALAQQALTRQLGGETKDLPSGLDSARKPGKGVPDMASNQLLSGSNSANSAVGSGQGQTDARAMQFTQKMESVQAQLSAVETAVAAATSSVGGEERARDRAIFKPVAVAEGVAALQSNLTSEPSTLALRDSGAIAAPDVYVAEQIKYWISNDVQNAEMKLDGIGDNPVEVSISMQGNEAHVTFRTDELQAREALESASSHLKELLQREGLVLSGVSVGTAGAGAGDSGAQERKPRQGAKSAVVVAAQPIRADMASASGRVSGRALDLFV